LQNGEERDLVERSRVGCDDKSGNVKKYPAISSVTVLKQRTKHTKTRALIIFSIVHNIFNIITALNLNWRKINIFSIPVHSLQEHWENAFRIDWNT
jgi:hypothetical protein